MSSRGWSKPVDTKMATRDGNWCHQKLRDAISYLLCLHSPVFALHLWIGNHSCWRWRSKVSHFSNAYFSELFRLPWPARCLSIQNWTMSFYVPSTWSSTCAIYKQRTSHPLVSVLQGQFANLQTAKQMVWHCANDKSVVVHCLKLNGFGRMSCHNSWLPTAELAAVCVQLKTGHAFLQLVHEMHFTVDR